MRALGLCAVLALALVAPARADEPKKDDAKKDEPKKELKTYDIPYRLIKTQHILVRAKINGKGPYNFIMDTGAPALYVSTALAKKLGVEADKKGWGTFDKVVVEGGLPLAKVKGKIEDPPQ